MNDRCPPGPAAGVWLPSADPERGQRCSVALPDPRLWEVPAMRQALARQDFTFVYRELRRVGYSQQSIAALTGQSQPEVSAIMGKGRQVQSCAVMRRIVDGLGIPRGYVGLSWCTCGQDSPPSDAALDAPPDLVVLASRRPRPTGRQHVDRPDRGVVELGAYRRGTPDSQTRSKLSR